MRKVRRYITAEQYIEFILLPIEKRSDWIKDNLLSQADYCGYGYYGYVGCGCDRNVGEDGEFYVEYNLGISCD